MGIALGVNCAEACSLSVYSGLKIIPFPGVRADRKIKRYSHGLDHTSTDYSAN
jgi:hypothetical protein